MFSKLKFQEFKVRIEAIKYWRYGGLNSFGGKEKKVFCSID